MPIKNHRCRLGLGSDSMLPTEGGLMARLCRRIRKLSQISQHHPQTNDRFSSYPMMMAERQRHLYEGGSYLIHPFSLSSLIWISIMTIVNLAHMCCSTFRLSYIIAPVTAMKPHFVDWIILGLNFFCWIDIVMKFNTGYVIGKMRDSVLDRTMIIWHYLVRWFLFDLLSSLPIALVILQWYPRKTRPLLVAHVFPLLRCARIYTVILDMKIILKAIHTEQKPIEYYMDEASMVADPSLDAVRDSAFALDRHTGVLTLTMQPTASMHGMFEFRVLAIDADGGSDIADVRIYLVSSVNRVTFIFVNTLEKVQESEDFIADTFSAGFRMLCHIDLVVQATDAQGVALEDETEVRAHFIRDNEPVLADEIEQLRSDTVLLQEIQNILRTDLLLLTDFFTGASPVVGTDPNEITIYVLAALAALLAFMCLVLLLTFIIRTRALNRRLEALSMTKYGSVDSGLNRVGIAAPGTNKHAVEGSNPIWNEVIKAPDFDAISDASYDSDLIGIEDLPQFRNDYFPPGDTSSLQDIMGDDHRNTVPNHSNNFGFNSTPFSPEFANSQFRRT